VVKENHPETFTEVYGSEVVSISIADAFSDVPVASPVMIDGLELMGNVSDETENEGSTATDDTRCPYKVMQAAAILQLQPQVREMKIS